MVDRGEAEGGGGGGGAGAEPRKKVIVLAYSTYNAHYYQNLVCRIYVSKVDI